MNTFRLSLGSGLALGALLFSVIGLLLVKAVGVSFIHFAGFLLFLATSSMIFIIARMVRTGRIRAKGAKKRRKRLLPMVYKKKPKAPRWS
jgi:hypothetical protein